MKKSKINEDNWLTLTLGYLEILLQVYKDETMPTMIDDSDHEERIEELKTLIKYLNK